MSIILRPDQQRVVAYRKGYMAVPAVPGAGKTTVLAYLAADLIAEGAPDPGRILIVTYTNSAVANFRSRIGDFLDERGYPRHQGYEVRTIHSLAMNIVRERPDALGWSDTFTILDEARLNAILERLTLRWIGRNRAVWESLIKPGLKGPIRNRAEEQWEGRTKDLFRSLIQAFKSRRINPETALGLTRHLAEESALRWAAEIYVDYQRELGIEGAVDFGDLMLGAAQLLAMDNDLLARLQERWTYIFEDEAQDSYRLQEQVLKLLAGPDGNLVRVGDANQAIMGTFTSAEPDLFRRFCREPGVDTRPLTMAGRSSPDIIELANSLVTWTREHHPEMRCRTALEDQFIEPVPPGAPFGNPQPAGYTIFAKTFETYEKELNEVARMAARSISRNPEKTVGVLMPTNAMSGTMVELLEQQGVKVRQLGGPTAPERQQTTLDMLSVMDFLAVPHEPARLVKVVGNLMHLPKVADAPFAAFLAQCRPEELFFPLDGSKPFETLYAACPECRGDIALHDALEKLRGWLPQAIIPADELVILLAGDMELTGEELTIAHHLSLRARRLLQENPAFGLPDATASLAGELQAMGRFSDSVYDRKGFKPLPGVVYVATCHSAKGLEWDTVYVAALTRAEYPAMASDKVRSEHWFLPDDVVNPEALAQAELAEVLGEDPGIDPVSRAKFELISERLRLLYVAVTRAKENLVLSCHLEDRWRKPGHPTLAYTQMKGIIDHRQRMGRA
ncbi:MAG TPA: ATP-dependent helicase [Symbiobacteriaceae bacterium]|nr:ATP-dependent helicase [Symbiobacteriaceae bacterium]